jgi:multiple sugar transport system ATP-binding protein
MAEVQLEKVSKIYPNGLPAVSNLDLDVAEGELMVLVGPSGSGKSTALRMVAGLEDITSGTLRMGGRVVNDLAPKDRNVAMVFQSYALYPHMTVGENIGFSLKLRKVPKDELNQKVKDAAALLGLTDYLNSKPGQLSGGLRAEISRIQRRVGVATFYVTHDQTEAMTMGDRVAVLHKGELQQCGTPKVLYEHPDNLFVAAFIGSPAMNLFEAILSPDGTELKLGSQSLQLPEKVAQARPRLAAYRDRKIIVGIRPENLADAALVPSDPGNTLATEVELVEALGNELQVHFLIDATRASSEDTAAATGEAELGELASLHLGEAHTEGVARISPRSLITAGTRASFVVDTDFLHFFDPDSTLAVWS